MNMIKKEMTQEKKIKLIQKTKKLEDVKLECLPQVQTEKYYFVSYSHKDYKEVYKDIYYLQSRGISIWYDRGMQAGKNWKDIAEKYINKHNCAGVIFYMSENSLVSDAIHSEIKFVKDSGKDFLTINLPIDKKYCSASEMLNILISKGKDISEDKIKFIQDNLNNDILYIKYSEDYDSKSEKIKNLKQSPLFEISQISSSYHKEEHEEKFNKYVYPYKTDMLKDQTYFETSAINDLEVKEVNIGDFKEALQANKLKTSNSDILGIGDSSFANCRKLESVTFTDNISVLGNFAFYNCVKLKDIDVSSFIIIKSHAFENCKSLETLTINLEGIGTSISDFLCANCINLKEINLPRGLNKIGKYAFSNTKLSSIKLEYLFGEGIMERAFENCKELKEFVINGMGEFPIKDFAFYNCDKLERFYVNRGTLEIQQYAFYNCRSLKEFPFELVSNIGSHAFSGCISLESLKLKCNVEGWAFAGCSKIKEIEFLPNDKAIELSIDSFRDVNCLQKVVFNCNVEFIASYSFTNCISLKEVYFNENVNYISDTSFSGCINLQKIFFAGTMDKWIELIHKVSVNSCLEKTGEYIVICKDGTLDKYLNKI